MISPFERVIMNSEKIDTTLNLSLETDVNIRQKSEVLSVGVNETEGTWEVVVKYHGDISEALESVMGVDILVNGYAIMVVTKEQLEHIVRYEQIEYVELPKSMQFNVYREKEINIIKYSVNSENIY